MSQSCMHALMNIPKPHMGDRSAPGMGLQQVQWGFWPCRSYLATFWQAR